MSLPKIVIIGAVSVFIIISATALMKKNKAATDAIYTAKPQTIQEINIEPVMPEKPAKKIESKEVVDQVSVLEEKVTDDTLLPDTDQIDLLFVTDSSKLPLVETVTYSSRVPWLSGRPAWIADYASHYETTRHFIARSLNKKADYFTQKVAPGDRFNVLKKDVSFHLLIDINRAKLWFYGVDEASNKRYLLKTYKVGLGRKDPKKASGLLTPLGKYLLGGKVAIYKPGTMGYFKDQQIEMLRVFGTRWMPFDKELSGCTDCAKGYGIHGAPWHNDPDTGKIVEERSQVGKYESDGCVRLYSEDIEEIFSVIISKPTTVELVNDFQDSKIPSEE